MTLVLSLRCLPDKGKHKWANLCALWKVFFNLAYCLWKLKKNIILLKIKKNTLYSMSVCISYTGNTVKLNSKTWYYLRSLSDNIWTIT